MVKPKARKIRMSKTPNLVYVFADQLRYVSCGYNGDKYAKTPNIDRLASEGTVMDNCVSNHPVCAPYRASLFTGKYTTGTGMVINEIRLNPNHRTFANILNENGYETCYIGKWHMYANQWGNHYAVKNSYIPAGPNRLGFNDYFAAYNFHHEYFKPKAYYHLNSPEKIYYEGYEPDAQTDDAIKQLNRLAKGEKPFSMFLSIGTPHDPWNKDNVPEKYYNMFKDVNFEAPPNYAKKATDPVDLWSRMTKKNHKNLNEWLRCYYAMVANLDYNIGRLFAEVEKLGLADNTIFVFTSDHGECFGAHGRRAKNVFYDEAVRVPFIIYEKGRIETAVNKNCFSTVDIMPTLLSLMNLPQSEESQGTDISDSVLNGTHIENASLLMCTGHTACWGNGFEWRAFRDERYTYAYWKDKEHYMFDNINDPYQQNNLYGNPQYIDEQNRLDVAMFKKMNEINDNFRRASYYKKHWVKNRKIKENLVP